MNCCKIGKGKKVIEAKKAIKDIKRVERYLYND